MATEPFTALTNEQWALFEPLFSSERSRGPGRPPVSPRFLVNAYIHFWLADKWVEMPEGASKTTANRSFNKCKEQNLTLLENIKEIANKLGILMSEQK